MSGPRRRRGVRPSRERLLRALAASGLKTRIAVAERIADQEATSSVPSGMVNRAFRGEPVEPQSLERIALALGVEAHTLYLASDESAATPRQHPAPVPSVDTIPTAPPDPAGVAPPAATHRVRPRWPWPVAVLVIALGLGAWITARQGPGAEGPPAWAGDEGPTAVVIAATGAVSGPALVESLSSALGRYWRILPAPAGAPAKPQRLLASAGIDRVVELDAAASGRFLNLDARVHEAGTMRVVWRGAVRALAEPPALERTMAQAARQIALGDPTEALPSEALTRYLSGRGHLDRVRTELNVRRALTEFESAIRLAPGFADAHAGLCEALVLDHVRTGHTGRLTEATHACGRALALAPDGLEGQRAQAQLERKRGETLTAITGFRAVLEASPSNTDAWIGLAESHLTRFGRGEDGTALEQALHAAGQAVALEPEFWKASFSLARVLYYGGRLDEAIEAAKRATELDPNVLALSNLGSFQFCRGDFDAAARAYERARESDPTAFVGEGQLGVVHYYRHDFARAAASFETALGLYRAGGEAEDHRLWGNYAHALRRSGRTDAAVNAYGRAIALAREAVSRGDGSAHDHVYLALYEEMLHRLAGPPNRRPTRAELDALEETTDPIGLLYLAILHGLHGDAETSAALKTRGAAGCPGFADAPDFDLLS